MDDDTIHEEYVEDAPFVGQRRDCPPPSICIGCDVFARYFLVVRSANGDLRLFWVVWVVTNSNLDPAMVTAIRFRFSTGCLMFLNT